MIVALYLAVMGVGDGDEVVGNFYGYIEITFHSKMKNAFTVVAQ